jgi:hypothetical protein
VRFVFTDEGGISRSEPWVVVAGVFVHGDDQLIPLEDELERLKLKHIPEEDRRDFVFHAKDIWSGKGIFKDREKWPLARRLDILHDLAAVPVKLDIPIVYEALERATLDLANSEEAVRAGRPPTSFEESVAAHAIVFCSCTLRIEQLMREVWPEEVAQMVAEDNDQVRALVKGTHENFRDPSRANGQMMDATILPLKKIRGSVHFANKAESKPLQLADLCAFVIRGHLSGHPHNRSLYDLIKPMMMLLPKFEIWPRIKSSSPSGGIAK